MKRQKTLWPTTSCGGAWLFSAIQVGMINPWCHMSSGHYKIAMDETSKKYTAFTVGTLGLFECKCMPFGLCNARATFQRLMQKCLGELNLMYCLIYLDNVIVFSKTEEDHLQCLWIMFNHCRENNLKLQPTKCEFIWSEINYLAQQGESESCG